MFGEGGDRLRFLSERSGRNQNAEAGEGVEAMSDVIDFEGRRAAELLKREAETEEEMLAQNRAGYEIGVQAALDMFDRLSEQDVDKTQAGVSGAMSGVLYAVIRCALDITPSVEIAREFISMATDRAEESHNRGRYDSAGTNPRLPASRQRLDAPQRMGTVRNTGGTRSHLRVANEGSHDQNKDGHR